MLKLESQSGEALKQYIPDLARLRHTVFRDWPYLYDGDLSYEENYLNTYIEAPNSMIVLALFNGKVVGASTGVPLAQETEEVKQPFLRNGYNIDTVFYCGESVLLPQYRGHGVGVAFFQYREAYARQLGGMSISCFCGVERPAIHPRRPADFVPLDNFWRKRGYQKHKHLQTTFDWKEIDEAYPSPKPMTFWLKHL